jgi:hypothetical protein
MRSTKRIIGILLGLTTTLATVAPALALQVRSLRIILGTSVAAVSTTHTWQFTNSSGNTIKSITFTYCKQPSGTCVTPDNLTTSAATKTGLTGLTDANWSLLVGTNGSPRLVETTGLGEGVTNTTIVNLIMGGINNSSIGDCNPVSNNSSDTCYAKLTTYTDTAGLPGNKVDEGIGSYTIIEAVQVTARVDPTFTFVVSAVTSNTAHNGVTTSETSTYSTLPFGNLTAGTPKYTAHQLNVTTNTENGYTVAMRMSVQMAGVYSANNIDPFAAATVSWSNPVVWSEPTGTTPNDNTSWIGANTSNNVVGGWTGADEGKFGPVASSENVVMQELRSDNGTVPTYVTYAIEANVFQPADTYTGTLLYSALPTY